MILGDLEGVQADSAPSLPQATSRSPAQLGLTLPLVGAFKGPNYNNLFYCFIVQDQIWI